MNLLALWISLRVIRVLRFIPPRFLSVRASDLEVSGTLFNLHLKRVKCEEILIIGPANVLWTKWLDDLPVKIENQSQLQKITQFSSGSDLEIPEFNHYR